MSATRAATPRPDRDGLRARLSLYPLVALACVLAALAGGCALSCAPTIDAGPCGEVRLTDRATKSNLTVVSHVCRHDARGRLVVFVQLRNQSRKPFLASITSQFAPGPAPPGPDSREPQVEELPPGETAFEWTSPDDAARTYFVEVRSGRLLQW